MAKGCKERRSSLKGAWITIGSFDGIHLGHQKIIDNLVKSAKKNGVPSIIITFYPHPAVHIRNITDPYYLTSPEEKDQIFSKLGVNSVLTIRFDHSISQLSPRDFINTLHRQLKFTCLLIGYDFHLGIDREGDIKTLWSYDLEEREDKEIMDMNWFQIAAGGEKMLFRKEQSWGITEVGKEPENGDLNTDAIQVKIDPVKEWRNIFNY